MREANRYARFSELAGIGKSTTVATTASTPFSPAFKSCSWTSYQGRYYYDLVHNTGRVVVWTKYYDTVSDCFINIDEEQPIDNNTLRIWVNTDYGTGRIVVYYF